jgi:hypothetical protein
MRTFRKSYIKEDVLTVLSLARRKKYADAAAYAGVYLSLAAHLPGDLWKRARIQRRRAGGASVEDILALNPSPWSCLNKENLPRLDGGTYLYYYRWILSSGTGARGAQ